MFDLNKTCIQFLKYLLMMDKIKYYEFYNYFYVKKINYTLANKYLSHLFKEGYIKKNKKYISPTLKTKIFFENLEKSKFKSFIIVHILPYIQQTLIFMLGLLTPYLLKLLKDILKHI